MDDHLINFILIQKRSYSSPIKHNNVDKHFINENIGIESKREHRVVSDYSSQSQTVLDPFSRRKCKPSPSTTLNEQKKDDIEEISTPSPKLSQEIVDFDVEIE